MGRDGKEGEACDEGMRRKAEAEEDEGGTKSREVVKSGALR